MIAEHGGALLALTGRSQIVGEMLAVKDVVAKDQAAAGVADELLADDESLS
ncbi:hypothetical protein D3C84_1119560 [compost metagenome]